MTSRPQSISCIYEVEAYMYIVHIGASSLTIISGAVRGIRNKSWSRLHQCNVCACGVSKSRTLPFMVLA